MQRQRAGDGSLSLLIGLYLNQQLRRDFLFLLITNTLKQSSAVLRSLSLLLHLRACHFCAKYISFILLCVAYCLKVKDSPTEEPLCSICMCISKKKQTAGFFKKSIEVIYIHDFKIPLLKAPLQIATHPERRKASVLSFQDAHFTSIGKYLSKVPELKLFFSDFIGFYSDSRRKYCTSFVLFKCDPFL